MATKSCIVQIFAAPAGVMSVDFIVKERRQPVARRHATAGRPRQGLRVGFAALEQPVPRARPARCRGARAARPCRRDRACRASAPSAPRRPRREIRRAAPRTNSCISRKCAAGPATVRKGVREGRCRWPSVIALKRVPLSASNAAPHTVVVPTSIPMIFMPPPNRSSNRGPAVG